MCLDADSILDQRALKELMRIIQEDPRVVAVGGQVAIANGCTIRDGRVVSVGLPSHPLARFQMVEYLRSFTTGRTGFDRLDSILILSGVFAVFEKETVIRAGGYLTPFVRHRIVGEYVGAGRHRLRGHGDRGPAASLRPRRSSTGGSRSCPIRWPGPRCPSRSSRSGNSAAAGTAGFASRCSITGTCSFPAVRPDRLVRPAAFWLFEYYGPMIEITGLPLPPRSSSSWSAAFGSRPDTSRTPRLPPAALG